MLTADVERMFSCMKRIKSYLRSRMGSNRFNKLVILSMEHTLVNEKVKSVKETFVHQFIRQKK